MVCVNCLLLGTEPTLKVVCFCRETPLEKTHVSFARGCQLEIASQLGMGARVYFSVQRWAPVWCRPL